MPSLLPGFEYDIFISYRQKDNKYDNWVTEFVDNLKKELEATFKEDVHLYFDINPHDGILDSYDIDESLKNKLKTLIFIPIISRTYCDPNSFAWQHEFKAFIEQASAGAPGLKVRLPNGNVSNRVFPVRIHDIDPSDIALYESVLGSPLRGIDFIYKEAGINRSLTVDDDEKKNLHATRYRNQMNKTALAIKDIITGLRDAAASKEAKGEIPGRDEADPLPARGIYRKFTTLKMRKVLAVLIALAALAAFLFFTGRYFLQKDKFRDLKDRSGKITLAVMPFNNLTGDSSLKWFETGMSSLLINGLGNTRGLAVRDEYTMFEVLEGARYEGSSGVAGTVAREVARKAEAAAYISGSFHGGETSNWVLVNLVNSASGEVMSTYRIQGNLKSGEYLDMVTEICSGIKTFFGLKETDDLSDFDFRDTYPRSSEAFEDFIRGMNSMMNNDYKTSVVMFKHALERDSSFAFASFFLAWVYSGSNLDIEAREWTRKAYASRDRIPPQYQPWLEQWNAFYITKNLPDILRCTNILEDSGIKSRWLWYDIGSTYCNFLQQSDKALTAFRMVMKISLERGGYWKYKPYYYRYSKALHDAGKHSQEKEIYRISHDLFGDDQRILANMAACALTMGEKHEADEYLGKISAMRGNEPGEKLNYELLLGDIYQSAGLPDEAREHYLLACQAEAPGSPVNSPGFFVPAYYLVKVIMDYDLDIAEGLEITDRELKKNPDNWLMLGLKGRGLYKLGKYREAENTLELARNKSIYFDYEIYRYMEDAQKALTVSR